MTIRNIPEINAFELPKGVECDAPIQAFERFRPIKAAQGDARTITIFGSIGETFDGDGVTSKRISAALRSMGAGDVVVNINSRGGDFFEGVSIYNMLREHDGAVTVNVFSLAASAASVIAMAADTLNVAKSGFLMVHNSSGLVIGDRNDLQTAAAMFARFDKAMAGTYADRSGMSLAEIAAMMDAETFLSGEDAVANGMADALLPADAFEEAEESPKASAIRELETILARGGKTRSQRRHLMKSLFDKPGAIEKAAMPSAGPDLSSFNQLIKTVRSL